jgi:hypothetical protein
VLKKQNNMNLQEQILRIQLMMGVISEDFSISLRRRIHIIKKLLDVLLENSYPCDFENINHFIEGILYDIDVFLLTFDVEGLSSDEVKDFIMEYLKDNIEQYYINASEDC